jgi:hypothetical protein
VVGTRRPEKGQNMKSMKNGDFLYTTNVLKFLDKTGCVPNEKMMPDVAVMVPELEIDRKVSNLYISEEKFTGPGACILTGRGRGVGGVITDPETQQYKIAT